MRVVTLVENDLGVKGLKKAHGLSLYIEFGQKKILFDLGPGNQYITNAKKLGVNLLDIDYCIISHGHFDHGRGISKFLSINKKAKVYVSKEAFGKHYKNAKGIYLPIGIRKPIFKDRLVLVEEDMVLDKGLKIYTDIPFNEQIIKDTTLITKSEEGYEEDRFDHEIYLVITSTRTKALFTDCSHKGIENIIDSIEKNEKRKFTAVVGGYHFSHFNSQDLRQAMYLEQLSKKFIDKGNVQYYTGHCTGDEAYLLMKNTMKSKLHKMKTGLEFKI